MNHSFTGIICSINPFMSSGAHNMLLRRFILHVRQQQWFAVTLDLVVVVLGVFVAFQVDRWYEAQQAESRALAHFDSLAADFAQNRERLLKAIGYADRQISAALALRNEARRAEAVLSIPELNRLYSETSGLPTFEAVDFAYRNLINSGMNSPRLCRPLRSCSMSMSYSLTPSEIWTMRPAGVRAAQLKRSVSPSNH
jgi:hypothetical protein